MANAEQKRSAVWVLWVAGLVVLIGLGFAIRSVTQETVRVRVAPVTYQTLTSTVLH